MQKQLAISALLTLSLTACSNQPNLYSPVLPMSDGTNQTQPTGTTKQKSEIRATRNAQRFCEWKNGTGFVVESINTEYTGLIPDQTTDKKINQAASVGGLGIFTGSEYITTLIFRCQ